MSKIGVGKEVLSYCNKCKLTLAHIIVTMKTVSTIGKVECKTCKATHAYKDPSAVKATKTKTGGLKRKASKKTESISDMWLELVSKATSQSQKYSPRTEFKQGDVIDHPKFGPGFIDKLIDNDKIQVIFRHEIKTLIHNK
ncbi:MAG: hypothetical protein GY909_04405 [Oligoflexia bacterium]|nr:hypothetical protein [Oligoflexia bacterium]